MPDDLTEPNLELRRQQEEAKQMAIDQLQPKLDKMKGDMAARPHAYREQWVDNSFVPEPWITITDWGVDNYLFEANEIDWLIEGILPRATPSILCSLGGVGKSYMMLDLGIRVAAGPGLGPQYAFGGRIPKRGKVVFITAEDSKDAVHRRLNQVLTPGLEGELQKAKLMDQFYMVPLADTGTGVRPLLVSVNGEYRMTDAWYELGDQIKALEATLVMLDPLAALVQADINADPAAAQSFWSAVSQLCAESGATVMVTHHMRKDGSREIDGPMAAREAIRGTTGLVDGARWVYCLWLPQAKDRDAVEQVIGEPLGELSMIQGAVVKSNDLGMTSTRTFIRDKQSGLLIDCTERVSEELDARKHLTDEQIQEVFGAVSARYHAGDPMSHHAAAKSRYLGTWMMTHFGITKDGAREYIQKWLAEGRLVKEPHPKIQRALGLRYEP